MTPAQGTKLVRESEIEAYLVKKVRAAGGECFKLTSPGMSGIPDRLVLLDGNVVFVEVKAPKGKLSALQESVMRRILEQQVQALVVWSKDDVDLVMSGLSGD